MPKRLTDQKGFSLVEVVLAVFILAAVGVTLIRVAVSARTSSPIQMYRTGAQNLARTQMENLGEAVRQDRFFVESAVNEHALRVGTTMGANQDVIVNGETYHRTYAVTDVDFTAAAAGAGGNPDYRKVLVTVKEKP